MREDSEHVSDGEASDTHEDSGPRVGGLFSPGLDSVDGHSVESEGRSVGSFPDRRRAKKPHFQRMIEKARAEELERRAQATKPLFQRMQEKAQAESAREETQKVRDRDSHKQSQSRTACTDSIISHFIYLCIVVDRLMNTRKP